MQEQDHTLPNNNNAKNDKFLFNLNNFDDPDPNEVHEEDLVPTFSEEELEAARVAGYEQGKQDGIAEEKASRDQKLAQVMGQILQNFQTLLIAEAQREQVYEEESLRLFHSALKNLFPTLNKRLGTKELEEMIERVVLSQHDKNAIKINVPRYLADDIHALLSQKMGDTGLMSKIHVHGEEDLTEGNCSLHWDDGGAVRDTEKLIENMILEVERLLPADTSISHASSNDDIREEIAEDSAPQSAEADGENE